MNKASTAQASSKHNRLAWRKPVVWLGVILLAVATVLGSRRARDREIADSLMIKRITLSDFPTRAIDVGRKRVVTSTDADRERVRAEFVNQFEAKQRSRDARLRAALILAEDGTDAAMQVLKETVASGEAELQQVVAQALGRCTNAESISTLTSLLTNASERVVVSAVRSMSRHGSPSVVTHLSEMLSDEKKSTDVRAEAALALGAIARPEALAALATAAVQIQDEAVASQVIRGVAGRPLDETQAFLQTFLDAPNVSSDLKVEALEGLSAVKGDPVPLLLDYAKNDDPDLRAAVARALSNLETPANAGAEIMVWLGEENDPLVRKRLYQALAHQESFDLNGALTLVSAEKDTAARIAALELLARTAQRNPSAELTAFVDEHALPELRNTAMNGATKDERMASVTALRRLHTPMAIAALHEIAAETRDAQVAAATGVRNQTDSRR